MKIKFATDILRRLGEELNPSLDKGILELVKNAYDADATNCVIELRNPDQAGGSVRVTDNGDGMTPDEIENGWLVLGRSSKDQQKLTHLHRIPAGSKGLGRLAALRMGSRALLTTRPKGVKRVEYNLLIDWDQYAGAKLVEDVNLELEESQREPGTERGTIILIEGLRERIGRRQVKRLARELVLLANPFETDLTGFKPVLKAPEYQDLEALVRSRYFRDADYHLVARVNDKGISEAKVVDHRGNMLFEADHDQIATGDARNRYNCTEVVFHLWHFILKKDSFVARSAPLPHVREWLQAFGGVHVYQNGLRVTPYGDQGSDWLDMNLSRVQSPEERPSTNNSIGQVSFTDTERLLIQKTDRSGFIESEAFLQIRQFAQDALDWMARRRLEEAVKRREREKKEAVNVTLESKKNLDTAVEKLPSAAREPVRKAVEMAWRSVDKRFRQYEEEIQLYRTLSTAGITSATFAHESAGNPIKVIARFIATIKRRALKQAPNLYETEFKEAVESIQQAAVSLAVLGDATLKLLDHEKRRATRVDVHTVIARILKTFKPFLDARKITICEPQLCEGSPYLRGSEAAVESIITNLLNNCVTAFEQANVREKNVLIKTSLLGRDVEVRIADSGPGIEGISKRDIWLPGRTTRKNGTGLGLTIVKDTVTDLGGEVDAIEHGELGGAEIIVRLPIIGS